MCVADVKASAARLKVRCECCGGSKKPNRPSWYCAKCARRIKSAAARSRKGR